MEAIGGLDWRPWAWNPGSADALECVPDEPSNWRPTRGQERFEAPARQSPLAEAETGALPARERRARRGPRIL